MPDIPYINEPADLGNFKMVIKDHFQFQVAGWVYPVADENDDPVPFDFFEEDLEGNAKYEVHVLFTLNSKVPAQVRLASTDDRGTGGESSVIMRTGTDAENDPSEIGIDAPDLFKDTDLEMLKKIEMGIMLVNKEGQEFTLATGTILNDYRNYK